MYAWFFFVSLLKDTVNVGVRWYFSNKLTLVIKKNTQRLVRENNIKVICKEKKIKFLPRNLMHAEKSQLL